MSHLKSNLDRNIDQLRNLGFAVPWMDLEVEDLIEYRWIKIKENLLFGENPNRAVREWTKPFHEAGIQTHMLDFKLILFSLFLFSDNFAYFVFHL